MLDDDRDRLFRGWIGEHGGAVLKVARAYTLTPEDCQDLTQEILFQVWRSLPRYRGPAGASTWAYRVALNTALGWHRKERRRRSRQRPILEDDAPSATGSDATDQALLGEEIERLYAAIRSLPRADAALILLYLDDLSYRQIAEVMGISEGNAGVKLTRAKKVLGELMEGGSHESR